MGGEHGRVEVGRRARLELEVAERVRPRTSVALSRGPATCRTRVGMYRIAYPIRRSAAVIGAGPVDHQDVMEGHLAGLEDDVDRVALVDLDRDLLAARSKLSG